MEPIYTSRLVLKGLKVSDKEDMYEYAKDPVIGYGAGWFPHMSLAESEDIIKSMIKSKEVYGIYLKKKLIGTIGIHKKEKENHLGYALSRKFWGHGYMNEACKAVLKYYFKTHYEIYARTFVENIRSQHVLKKLGFEYIKEEKIEALDTIKHSYTFKLDRNTFIKEL